MNNLVKLSLTLPLIVTLSACGGGGEPVVETPPNGGSEPVVETPSNGGSDPVVETPSSGGGDPVVELSDATSVLVLERIHTHGPIYTQNDSSKPSTSTSSLTYVADNQGDIYGVAAIRIPRDVEFSADDTANAYVQMGQDEYVLTNGTVAGSIGSSGDLSVTLSFVIDDIDFNSETNQLDITTDMQLEMDSTVSGASDCGAVNVFCAGTLTVLKDSATVETATLDADDYKTGVFGTESNPELGGGINYVDEGNLSVTGSFLAAKD